MKLNTLKTFFAVVTLFTALTLTGCEKDFNTYPAPEPEPIEQVQPVYQSFGLQIGKEESDISAKSFDITTWVPQYSPTAYTLTITGTGASTGTNYTESCTVAELKANAVSLSMLPGTYKVTYLTVHQQASGWSMQGHTLTELTTPLNRTVGQYLDIKIDNNLTVTGTPLTLTATLEDCLVVIDIPDCILSFRHASITDNPDLVGASFLNEKKDTDGIFYGYVNAQPLFVCLKYFNSSVVSYKRVDLTSAVNGKAYHLISPLNAGIVLNIPNLTSENIIVP